MSLAITLPEKKVSAWMVETTVDSTQAWLTRLPIADSAETARELYQALFTLNRIEVPPKLRIELMELYRQPVAQVTGKLHNRLSSSSFPLSEKRKQLAEFVRDLQAEMAIGYKLSLFGLERAKRPVWSKGSTRALAIYMSLHYLGNVVLRSAYYYLPYPKNLWKEIHSLFGFAEKNRCTEEAIREYAAVSDRTSTILKRYKEILLFGLADPYQIPFEQCRNINEFIYRWADLAVLAPLSPDGAKRRKLFRIDMRSDQAGLSPSQNIAFDANGVEHLRMIDAEALVDHVSSMIRQIHAGTRPADLDLGTECLDEVCIDLLRRLERAWSGVAKRRASRLGMNGQVSICIGLGPIHFYSQEYLLQENVRHQSTARLVSSENISSNAFRVDRWDMLDASTGGIQIRGHRNTEISIRVGDLVGLLGDKKAVPLKLFRVRWLRENGVSGIEAGLELISSKIIPVLVGEEHGAGGYVPCLILEKTDDGGTPLPRTLLLPQRLRGKQKTIELVKPDDTKGQWVRILEVVDQTISYERVTFAALETRERK